MELLSLHLDSNGGLSQKDMTHERLDLVGVVPRVSDGSERIIEFGKAALAFLTSSTVKTTASLARIYGTQFMALLYNVINKAADYEPDTCVMNVVSAENEVLSRLISLVKSIKRAVMKIEIWDKLKADLKNVDQAELEPILGEIENYELFKSNPYRAMDKSRKVLFKTVDKLAASFSVGFETRLLNNLKQRLKEAVYEQGHCCYLVDSVIEEARWKAIHKDIRDADYQFIMEFIEKQTGVFKIRGDYVYLASVYHIESGVVSIVEKIIDDGEQPIAESEHIDRLIKEFEGQSGIELNKKQRVAVNSVFTGQRMFIVTGYPGTGKSSIVACVTYIASCLAKSCLLCAPTGKASMRLGREAQTIHRLLKLIDLDDEHPTTGKIDAEILIVDEVSMLDLHLAYSLLSSCAPYTRILFLGDANQLPSVRYGNVLADLLEIGLIGSVLLTKIYRQDDGSSISKAARCVIDGQMPPSSYLKSSDVTYYDCDDDDEIQRQVVKLYEKFGDEICILIPTKKGDLGTWSMNNVIHKKKFGEKSPIWMVGEKVICIKNLYERKDGKIDIDRCVFNGQTGAVVKLKTEALDVRFDNGVISVGKRDLDKAYCLTVHKSQGSEYDTVAVVLHKSQGACLYRQLLYTAMTRAKKQLYVIGPRNVFERCVRTVGKKRFSLLAQRILDLYDVE